MLHGVAVISVTYTLLSVFSMKFVPPTFSSSNLLYFKSSMGTSVIHSRNPTYKDFNYRTDAITNAH